MRKTVLLVAAIVALGMAGLIGLVLRQANLPVRVTVVVQGQTNDGVRAMAVLRVTNVGACRVRRWSHHGVETRQASWQANPQYSSSATNGSLAAGEAETVFIPVPTNAGPWKAAIFCSRENWRTRGQQAFWWRWVPNNGIPTETILTDWMEK